MPLPIAPGGRPTRPPTHKPIDLQQLITIASELEEALDVAGASALTPEVVEELAADLGASETRIYAAAALMTEIGCDHSAPTRFELCIGGCQGWGAVELLGHLLKRHAQRREGAQVPFGIVAKRCLDKCEHAPMVLLHTPDGTAGLPEATIAQLDEALAQID
jgi:NADH:ubiquinone oxidoreductase subunit E